ncbi:hypothetical protein CLOM_g1037 [Closterium sp. NIES-68]|nr:hypothetical protein CLOM_g1037 [Closterium sp. NIES-68]GJP63026.1 hypothetical protein CLOP_g20078 [Closterium sp. NIES-67]
MKSLLSQAPASLARSVPCAVASQEPSPTYNKCRTIAWPSQNRRTVVLASRSTSTGRVRESSKTTTTRAGSSSSSGHAKSGKNNRKGGAKGAGKSAVTGGGSPAGARKQASSRRGRGEESTDDEEGEEGEKEEFWGRGGGEGSDMEDEDEDDDGGDSEEEAALKLPMPSPPAGFVLDDEGEVVLAAPAERRTLTIHDPITNRSLDCVIRRAFSNALGVPFFLLHPLDTPIMFFRISGRTGELQEVDDEEAERIMPAAAYALAKKSLHLTPSGFTLTLRGAICFTEDDVINLDTELGFGIGGSLAEGVDITTCSCGGQEYMIYTPFDPLMFVAYRDPKTNEILVAEDPELLNDPNVLDAIDEEQQFQAMVEAEEEMAATLEQTAMQATQKSTQKSRQQQQASASTRRNR